MLNITVASNGDDCKIATLWREYAERVNDLTQLLIRADIDTELLAEVIRATINLYRDNE
jgi:hypothetical protein